MRSVDSLCVLLLVAVDEFAEDAAIVQNSCLVYWSDCIIVEAKCRKILQLSWPLGSYIVGKRLRLFFRETISSNIDYDRKPPLTIRTFRHFIIHHGYTIAVLDTRSIFMNIQRQVRWEVIIHVFMRRMTYRVSETAAGGLKGHNRSDKFIRTMQRTAISCTQSVFRPVTQPDMLSIIMYNDRWLCVYSSAAQVMFHCGTR